MHKTSVITCLQHGYQTVTAVVFMSLYTYMAISN